MSELVVDLAGRRAGALIRKDNGNLQFRYDEGYEGPPVSYALPIQREAHPHAVCRAVFGGLLLEGDGRDALASNLGVSPENDFALLEEVGGDCAGAITLLRPGETAPTEPQVQWLDAEQVDARLAALPARPLAADPDHGVRLSLAGAQPKLPVVIDGDRIGLPTNSAAATTHIIKPEPDHFPGLVDDEAFCMELASAVGLAAAAVEKKVGATGIPYLVVERYDRDIDARPIRRIHQEDFCQALGHPADGKYQSEGGPGVKESVVLLRAAARAPATELPHFWAALVFNWAIGNCDAHAKNFSLLYDDEGPRLAPLYDLLSTTVFGQVTTRLAMSIDGATDVNEVTSKAWDELAAAVGFGERFAREATARTVAAVKHEAPRLASRPEHDNDTARAITERIASLEA